MQKLVGLDDPLFVVESTHFWVPCLMCWEWDMSILNTVHYRVKPARGGFLCPSRSSTKADLTAAVFTRFFGQALFEECCRVDGSESFTDYVRKLRGALGAALADMDIDWFAEMRRLPRSEHEALEAARVPMLAHMEQGLQYVLEADPAVVRSRLIGALSPEKLCPFVLGAIFTSLMEGSDCEPLFALLDTSLYEAVAERVASGSASAAPIEKKDC